RDHLAYRSVADIPNFPFATYDEFVQAVKDGKAGVSISCGAFNHDARLTWTLGDWRDRIPYCVLLTTPAWMALGFILIAFLRPDAWMLLGVLACLLGMMSAAPNLSLSSGCLAWLCFFPAMILAPFFHPPLILAGIASLYCWLLSSFAVIGAFEDARNAVTRSETVFLWMYQRKKVEVVRSSSGSPVAEG
ncbi:MAG: hypothetical protein M3Y13_02095, partial [Armatimonadota bacterium]|nr:hypothetical protein [Armatimonadota bacterium]